MSEARYRETSRASTPPGYRTGLSSWAYSWWLGVYRRM